jgi:outer membrane protein OmpA-like peptidoglycan-associated protein
MAQAPAAPDTPFQGTWVAQDGAVIAVTSDGRRVEGRLVAPSAALAYGWKSGDVSFEATVTGQDIVGKLYDYLPAEALKACPKVGVIKNDLQAKLVDPNTLVGRFKSTELKAAGCRLNDLGWGDWRLMRKAFDVSDTPREISILLLDSVLFDSDSDVIKRNAVIVLREIKAYILDQQRFVKMVVERHTDDRGTEAHNLDLSRRRSNAVMSWLTQNGVDKRLLEVRAVGRAQPIASNDTIAKKLNNPSTQNLKQGNGLPISIEK